MGTHPTPGPPTAIDLKVIELLRAKTPEEKLRMTFDRIDSMRALRRATEHLRPARKP